MNKQRAGDLDAFREVVSDIDHGDRAAMARAAGMLTGPREPFTVQHVDRWTVPGMVVLDLPDDEALLIEQEKYETARRAIAEVTGVGYQDVDLAGLRLMLDEQGVPMLEPPIN